jgi:S-adenosylmethionine-diacylgycerolhomoserine-N-methlytransferase
MSARASDALPPDHAALMDSVYRRQRHIYDITRKYYLFGRDRMIRDLNLSPGERVVEVGCGTARNLAVMARHYPQAKLYGLDASAEMLCTAGDLLSRAGLQSRVRLAHGYAENMAAAQFGEDAFDRVIFSYSLSMIPDWRQALGTAAAALAPNGRIHVVDFGDLEGLGRIGRRAMLYWLGLFHVAPRTELLGFFEALGDSLKEINGLRVLPGRYAFIGACSAAEARQVAGKYVAA